MNIYLVQRTDSVWYDQTAGMVIIAKTEERAIKYFIDEVNKDDFSFCETKMTADRLSIRRIGVTLPDYVYDVTHSVLTDFRAG
jgi:hypothetical protein